MKGMVAAAAPPGGVDWARAGRVERARQEARAQVENRSFIRDSLLPSRHPWGGICFFTKRNFDAMGAAIGGREEEYTAGRRMCQRAEAFGSAREDKSSVEREGR